MRASRSASQAWESTSCIFAITIRLYMSAARSPPRSEPAKILPTPAASDRDQVALSELRTLELLRMRPVRATANPGANINAAASLRSVNYMVNHICELIQSRRATSSELDRTVQDGDRARLTLHERVLTVLYRPNLVSIALTRVRLESYISARPLNNTPATHPETTTSMSHKPCPDLKNDDSVIL